MILKILKNIQFLIKNLQVYKIVFKKSAAKEFLSLPDKIKKEIEENLTILSIWRTNLLDIKILQPKEEKRYRLRVWKYRVIYKIYKEQLIISIIKIWSRWDIYR